MMSSILEKMNEIDILKINIDKYPEIVERFNVMSIPTLILFEKGRPIKARVGFMNERELKDFIK